MYPFLFQQPFIRLSNNWCGVVNDIKERFFLLCTLINADDSLLILPVLVNQRFVVVSSPDAVLWLLGDLPLEHTNCSVDWLAAG